MTEVTEKFEIPATIVPIVNVLSEKVKSANSLALAIKDAKSGADLRVNKVLNESDDKEIAEWREWDAKAAAKIAELQATRDQNSAAIKAKAATLVEGVEVNVDALQKEFLTLRQEVTSLRGTISVLVANDEATFGKILEAAGIEEIVNVRKGTAGAVVSGKRKPRLASATLNGENVESPTFTVLASKTGVDIDVLKKAAYDAAGTDDLFTKVGETIEFSVVGKDEKTHTLTIVPRTDAKAKDESK